MRVGINPVKNEFTKLNVGEVRLIIPFFMRMNSPYFKDSKRIFFKCIESIIRNSKGIDLKISVILNTYDISLINELYRFDLDRLIMNKSNQGKVFSCINEAKSSKEEFIGIIDSDVYFRSGWFEEARNIFNISNNIGVVSLCPQPNLAFYNNNSFYGSLLISKMKFDSLVKREELELFELGVGNSNLYKGSIDWENNQLGISRGSTIAIVGAGHFASIYRGEVFNEIDTNGVEYVFRNADENAFLDKPIDKKGYFRFSTKEAFVYHMGNTFETKIKGFEDKVYLKTSTTSYPIIANHHSSYLIGKLISKIVKLILKSK
ncbi:MAG: glycosyltransferase family A protein [Flavobacteriaceae bacterium]